MSLIDEINEKRNELEELERQYAQETPCCTNTDCSFHRPEYRNGKCAWTVLIEECKDYTTD